MIRVSSTPSTVPTTISPLTSRCSKSTESFHTLSSVAILAATAVLLKFTFSPKSNPINLDCFPRRSQQRVCPSRPTSYRLTIRTAKSTNHTKGCHRDLRLHSYLKGILQHPDLMVLPGRVSKFGRLARETHG